MRRPLLAAGALSLALILASVAFGARGFSDPAGDTNAAPDLTSVEVAEASPGTISVRLRVANYATLPPNSWFNLWFDVDSNPETGDDAGDEALVRYLANGTSELFTWNGAQYVAAAATGVSGTYAAGALNVSVPRSSVKAAGTFGLLVVGSRGQPVGDEELVASDFAPETGRSAFTGPAAATYPDAAGDHDAAPDVTAVRVSDVKTGWVTFAITTPNYAVLPEASAVVISIDADDNPRTGEAGTELQLTLAAGEIRLERWDGRGFVPDDLPTRARHRNAANLVSIDLHVSELGNRGRFRFSLLTADVNTAIQGVVALDLAPDDLTFWRYSLANKPALRLEAGRVVQTPARPRAGKPFAVALPVVRSDTRRPVTSGSVICRVQVGGKRVVATGRVARGAGRCSLVVAADAKGQPLRGTIAVRSAGASATASFAYVVR
ncbi:MAG TPA: hypothetical protein VEW90_07835 [Gaiellaceae bacterium]|nr:hypothetical protein [Gaiellaceae bacterium]